MGFEYESLVTPDTKIKVSSTLDKSVAKKYLVDNNPETCWTSQQGLPQYIELAFPRPVDLKRLSLTFQGGFVGTRCSIKIISTPSDAGNTDTSWQDLMQIYPEDVNRKQIFDLINSEDANAKSKLGVLRVRLMFEESSDFFGRITVYDLKLEGAFL